MQKSLPSQYLRTRLAPHEMLDCGIPDDIAVPHIIKHVKGTHNLTGLNDLVILYQPSSPYEVILTGSRVSHPDSGDMVIGWSGTLGFDESLSQYDRFRLVSSSLFLVSSDIPSGAFAIQGRISGSEFHSPVNWLDLDPSALTPYNTTDSLTNVSVQDGAVIISQPEVNGSYRGKGDSVMVLDNAHIYKSTDPGALNNPWILTSAVPGDVFFRESSSTNASFPGNIQHHFDFKAHLLYSVDVIDTSGCIIYRAYYIDENGSYVQASDTRCFYIDARNVGSAMTASISVTDYSIFPIAKIELSIQSSASMELTFSLGDADYEAHILNYDSNSDSTVLPQYLLYTSTLATEQTLTLNMYANFEAVPGLDLSKDIEAEYPYYHNRDELEAAIEFLARSPHVHAIYARSEYEKFMNALDRMNVTSSDLIIGRASGFGGLIKGFRSFLGGVARGIGATRKVWEPALDLIDPGLGTALGASYDILGRVYRPPQSRRVGYSSDRDRRSVSPSKGHLTILEDEKESRESPPVTGRAVQISVVNPRINIRMMLIDLSESMTPHEVTSDARTLIVPYEWYKVNYFRYLDDSDFKTGYAMDEKEDLPAQNSLSRDEVITLMNLLSRADAGQLERVGAYVPKVRKSTPSGQISASKIIDWFKDYKNRSLDGALFRPKMGGGANSNPIWVQGFKVIVDGAAKNALIAVSPYTVSGTFKSKSSARNYASFGGNWLIDTILDTSDTFYEVIGPMLADVEWPSSEGKKLYITCLAPAEVGKIEGHSWMAAAIGAILRLSCVAVFSGGFSPEGPVPAGNLLEKYDPHSKIPFYAVALPQTIISSGVENTASVEELVVLGRRWRDNPKFEDLEPGTYPLIYFGSITGLLLIEYLHFTLVSASVVKVDMDIFEEVGEEADLKTNVFLRDAIAQYNSDKKGLTTAQRNALKNFNNQMKKRKKKRDNIVLNKPLGKDDVQAKFMEKRVHGDTPLTEMKRYAEVAKLVPGDLTAETFLEYAQSVEGIVETLDADSSASEGFVNALRTYVGPKEGLIKKKDLNRWIDALLKYTAINRTLRRVAQRLGPVEVRPPDEDDFNFDDEEDY